MFEKTAEHVHTRTLDDRVPYSYPSECPVMGECEAQIPGCSGQGQCQPDPYDIEVHDEVNYRILCDHCAGEMADDV